MNTHEDTERFDRLATQLLSLEIDGKPIDPQTAVQIARQIIDLQIEFCLCAPCTEQAA